MYVVYMAAPQALALGDPAGFRAQQLAPGPPKQCFNVLGWAAVRPRSRFLEVPYFFSALIIHGQAVMDLTRVGSDSICRKAAQRWSSSASKLWKTRL